MKNWSAGYVADVAYTFGYYSELNPLRVDRRRRVLHKSSLRCQAQMQNSTMTRLLTLHGGMICQSSTT